MVKESIEQERVCLLENKKKFLMDIIDVLPIDENTDINNSIKKTCTGELSPCVA